MWFILYLACFYYIFSRTSTETRPIFYRRVLLIDLINMHKIQKLEWLFRGKNYDIILTSKSVAKPSRNRRLGIDETNGIIIKYFWLDGKLCNTDTFDMKNLRFNRP